MQCRRRMSAEMEETLYGAGSRVLTLAAGSPGELGLIAALAEVFAPRADACIRWLKTGTGESLRLLRARQVDLALAHAPQEAAQAAAEGWAGAPVPFAANRYCLLGPADDPAGVRAATDAVDAFRRIARSGRPFVSRGDGSGTHHRELALWEAAGVRPQAGQYLAVGDFMIACLQRANAACAYFLCDSSTWIMERDQAPELALLFDADPALINRYCALLPPPGATSGYALAESFARFLVSAEGQAILRGYGRDRFGQALYEAIAP